MDGDEKTIYLTSDHQSVAYVKADPCLKHNVSLKQFNNFTESLVTNYNIKSYFSDTWFLGASLSERMCLNKDNMTVNILEPIEQFSSCIITRGKQKVDKLKYHGNVISGEVTLALKDSANKTYDQPDQNNIIIPVNGVKMCTENYEENNTQTCEPKPTTTTTHLTQIENSRGDRSFSAKIAVSLTIMALIVNSIIAGFIFWKKQKQKQRDETEALTDENPVYREYEVDENGEARSETTAEVIDSSPFYGESVEDWEGATIKDQNNYYDS